MSHPAYTLLFAVLLSAAIALIGDRPVRDRVYASIYHLVCCAAAVFTGAWLMRWIHG